MPPRIQFKHIKRPEEIPPPPVPAKCKPYSPRPHVEVPEDEDGWWHYRVTDEVRYSEPESSWRTAVWEFARHTGYEGTMYDFYCRDCRESKDYTEPGIRFSWHVWKPRPPKFDRVLR